MLKIGLSRFLQMRLSFLLFSILPFRVASIYLALLGWMYCNLLNRRERGKIERNINLVFKRTLTSRQAKSLTRKTISNLLAHYAEKLFQACYSHQKWVDYIQSSVEFKGLEALDRALSKGKGVLIATGHLGAREFLPSSLAIKGYPLAIMAKFKTEKLRAISFERAASIGLWLVDCEKDPHPLIAAIKCLRDGKALIFQCDEAGSWHPGRDRQLEFLGYKVPADKTVDLIVKKSGCEVVMAHVLRTGGHRYLLQLEEIGEPINGETTSELLLNSLQEHIYDWPEQWQLWAELDAMIARGGEAASESPEESPAIAKPLYA